MNVRIIYFCMCLFFISNFLTSCQSEDMYIKNEGNGVKSGVKIKHLKGIDAKKAENLLKSVLSESGGLQLGSGNNAMRTDEESIDYNNILLVLDTLGIKNYTFKILNHPDDNYKTFHNLVLTEKEGTLELAVMKYEMTDLFANDYNSFLKTFYEFQGKISALGLSTALDPCTEIIRDYPATNPSDPDEGGGYVPPPTGDPGANPGDAGPGGPGECYSMNFYFECSCGRRYNTWDDYINSICGDGSYPGYNITMVVVYSLSNNCRLPGEPCSPNGVIGVIEPDNPCKTSKDKLKLVFPNTPDDILEEIATNINEYGKDFGINSKEKLQHFLSQAGHESTSASSGIEFGTFVENLNYRISKLGSEVFNRYFNPVETPTADPNKANPNDYVSATNSTFVDNEMFANYVYNDANRSEKGKLGNVNTGDGYKFIGRGIFQLTGRTNYTNFNTFYKDNYDSTVNLLETPELVASDKKIAVISALWFFKNNVLDKLSPALDSNTTCLSVSKLVNGGTNGLTHRTTLFTSSKTNIDCL